jgi:hypothetical protein
MQKWHVFAIVIFLLGAGAGVALCTLARGGAQPEADAGEIRKIVNPLVEVEVGEWALYRLGDGKTMRLEVRQVHPVTRVVTVLEEHRDAKTNAPLSSGEKRIIPNHFLWGFDSAGALVARIYPDPITVAGRTFDSFCVETSGRGMGPIRHWYSPQVPVFGLIRQERLEGGPYSVQSELIDWSGRSGD